MRTLEKTRAKANILQGIYLKYFESEVPATRFLLLILCHFARDAFG